MAHDSELFKKAEVALKKQNFDYAIELLLQGLVINPKALGRRRRLHQVETLAIQEKGGNPQGGLGVKFKALPFETKAKKLHMQKKYEEEIVELEKSLRFQPQNISTLTSLGHALENADHLDAAVEVYEEIIELDNTQVEAYRKLGKLYDSHREDPEKAIECWERLKQFKPDDKEASKAIRNISAAQMVRKTEERKARAGDESFRAMLKDEDEADDLQRKQQIIRTDADRVRAIKFKVEEIKKDPKNSRLWRDLGVLYQDLKQWEKAEQSFRKALQVNPQDLFAQERIGQLAETRLENELEELKAKLDGSDDPKLLEEVEKGEKELLAFKMKEYGRRVEAHPTDYALKLKYGRILKQGGDYDKAIVQFQLAVKDPKNKVASRKEIGECFIAKELPDMAKDQFSQALDDVADKESSLWKEIKYNLGLACQKNGERKEALRHFQEIMAIDISYQDISDRVKHLRTNAEGA